LRASRIVQRVYGTLLGLLKLAVEVTVVTAIIVATVVVWAYSSSLTLKPMDFVRSGGFTMFRLPLSPYQPRLAAALKNQQVRLR
jgi:hypothetical protein